MADLKKLLERIHGYSPHSDPHYEIVQGNHSKRHHAVGRAFYIEYTPILQKNLGRKIQGFASLTYRKRGESKNIYAIHAFLSSRDSETGCNRDFSESEIQEISDFVPTLITLDYDLAEGTNFAIGRLLEATKIPQYFPILLSAFCPIADLDDPRINFRIAHVFGQDIPIRKLYQIDEYKV